MVLKETRRVCAAYGREIWRSIVRDGRTWSLRFAVVEKGVVPDAKVQFTCETCNQALEASRLALESGRV